MNATSQEILRQICNGGPCPQTSIRTNTPQAMNQTPSELIGQIIRPRGTTARADSAAPQAPSGP